MKSAMFVIVLCAACGKDSATPTAQAAGSAPPPTEVSVVEATSGEVTLSKELPGRTSALRVAEVRARVNGIVLKRAFTEGADVKEGQLLFQIDPAPYQATLDQTKAAVARAEATAASAKLLGERYGKLIESNAISRQEYDDAVARVKTAEADVAAARAAMKAAQINVQYTRVTSPITGRIGRADVTEGAYVQAGSATLLATVQQLDKLYVDMTWSSREVMRMRKAIEDGSLHAPGGEAKVSIILEDGRVYGAPGTLQFADASVDPTTGSILLRATVPNPKGELFPGMFVRARVDEGTSPSALLVPQRAVTRDQSGKPVAMVVKDGKAERRPVVTDRAVGDSWLVTSGIAAGEQVIVEGLQKVRPGAPVRPVPFVPGKSSVPQVPLAAGNTQPQQGSAAPPAQGSSAPAPGAGAAPAAGSSASGSATGAR